MPISTTEDLEVNPPVGCLGSISAALSCLVYPPREEFGGGARGSFTEQRLVIEPRVAKFEQFLDF